MQTVIKIQLNRLTIHPERKGYKRDKQNELLICRNGKPGHFYVVDGVKRFKELRKTAYETTAILVSPEEAMPFIARLPQPDVWQAHELQFIKRNLGYMTYPEMGQELGRSEQAVRCCAKRNGWRNRNEKVMTISQASRALGVGRDNLIELMERGHFPRPEKWLKKVTLYRWAINPMNWPFFIQSIRMPRRMKDDHLRRLVLRQKSRWRDEWLSIGEAAKLIGLASSSSLHTHLDELGAVRWQNHFILRSEVLACNIKPKSGNHCLEWSARADAFMLAERAKGAFIKAIALKMKRYSENQVRHRIYVLENRRHAFYRKNKLQMEMLT